MKHSARILRFSQVLFLGVLVSLCACHKAKAGGAQALAEDVARVSCSFFSDPEKDFEAIEDRFDRLRQDNSRNADQALVMLMGYYLGEHNWEELEGEIVRRGQRMKPLLLQEQRAPAVLSTCAPRQKAENLKGLVNSTMEAIDHESRANK